MIQLLTAIACVIALFAGYALLVRLIRTLVSFINEAVDVAVALFFYLVIVPPLWLWEKGRRPMWRTLTKQQSDDLAAWLHRG